MKSRAFIKAAVPEDLIVETGEGQMLVYAADHSIAGVIVKRFILFPLALLPVALLAFNICQYNVGLPMVDYQQLLDAPAAFFENLPQGQAFWAFALAPVVAAFLFHTAELCRVLRRPRLLVTSEGITLTTQFPTASSSRVELANIEEVQIIDYGQSFDRPPAQFLTLALSEGIWDYLAVIEGNSREGTQKLYTAADFIGRTLAKPVRHVDSKGNTVEREPS
jgi:hypothetical protein